MTSIRYVECGKYAAFVSAARSAHGEIATSLLVTADTLSAR